MNIPRLTATASLYLSNYPYHIPFQIIPQSQCDTLALGDCIEAAGNKQLFCTLACRSEGCTIADAPGYCSNDQCCYCLSQCETDFHTAALDCQSKYGCPTGKACVSDVNIAYSTL